MEARRLKRAIIKEEYIAITGNYVSALILNQFIYWSERVKDVNEYIKQEKERAAINTGCDMSAVDVLLTNGWIYKTSQELGEELMLGMSDRTIRKYIKKLEDLGFLHERRNPRYKCDNTLQYRVDLVAVQKALLDNGYTLDGYKMVEDGEAKNTSSNEITFCSENNPLLSENSNNSIEMAVKSLLDSEECSINSEAVAPNSEPASERYQRLLQRLHTETINRDNNSVCVIEDSEKEDIASDDALTHTPPAQTTSSKKSTKEPKHRYGEYENVLLTDKELSKLTEQYGKEMTNEAIKFLDEYIAEKKYKANSHYLSIRRWVIDAVNEQRAKRSKFSQQTGRVLTRAERDMQSFYDMADEWARE